MNVVFEQRLPLKKSEIVLIKKFQTQKFEKFIISSLQIDLTQQKQPSQSKDMNSQK